MLVDLTQKEGTTMLRGVKRIRCPHCGHRFLAFDIEDKASINSMVTHCPKCGMVVKVNWNRILGTVSDILEHFGSVMKKREGWI